MVIFQTLTNLISRANLSHVLTEDLMANVIGGIAQQAVERIDRTRVQAGKFFSGLIHRCRLFVLFIWNVRPPQEVENLYTVMLQRSSTPEHSLSFRIERDIPIQGVRRVHRLENRVRNISTIHKNAKLSTLHRCTFTWNNLQRWRSQRVPGKPIHKKRKFLQQNKKSMFIIGEVFQRIAVLILERT